MPIQNWVSSSISRHRRSSPQSCSSPPRINRSKFFFVALRSMWTFVGTKTSDDAIVPSSSSPSSSFSSPLRKFWLSSGGAMVVLPWRRGRLKSGVMDARWRPSRWMMRKERSCLEILHQMLERCSPREVYLASARLLFNHFKLRPNSFTHIVVNIIEKCLI